MKRYYCVSTFRETYAHAIQPILDEDKPKDVVDNVDILRPDGKRGPSRPKTKRIPNTESRKPAKA
ncbi:hypothetical protein FRX31_017368 [Thalictrum thalictroides]|uniref:Uncharacterized protein n=1 Tax=Thalictrum thalictroides TaxID=46969 RepID=A0A7J6W9H9_THATH|nr:hypothetical protein FRX31_017368 [Thalictrum thalictroides]